MSLPSVFPRMHGVVLSGFGRDFIAQCNYRYDHRTAHLWDFADLLSLRLAGLVSLDSLDRSMMEQSQVLEGYCLRKSSYLVHGLTGGNRSLLHNLKQILFVSQSVNGCWTALNIETICMNDIMTECIDLSNYACYLRVPQTSYNNLNQLVPRPTIHTLGCESTHIAHACFTQRIQDRSSALRGSSRHSE